MHVQSTNNVLVSLSISEVETIISALETDWQEWQIDNAGVLLIQFQRLHEDLVKKQTQIADDSN